MTNKIKITLLYTLIIIVGILSALLLYFYQNFYRSDYYLPGVHIASLPMQGYSKEEAALLLNDHINDYLSSQVIFFTDEYKYETQLKNLCYNPPVKEIIENIWRQEQERNIYSKVVNLDGSQIIAYPVKIEYNPESIKEMIKEWDANLATEYINARLEIDKQKGLIVIPGSPGTRVDVDLTLKELPQEFNLNQKSTEIRVPIVIQEKHPIINASDLQNMGELASFTTWYNVHEVDRSHNLKKAADSINGTVIAPGDVFSFNNVVGPRTYETGYRDAMIIIGGIFEPGLGGGICQVSSTLYNAALLAGLDIVERHNHALAVAYIPLGRDATVAYGLQDFKFRNNTNYPIYIRANAVSGNLTINIYGDMNYKQKITISSIVDQVIDFIEIRKEDSTLEPGTEKVENEGIPGYIARSFRTFYDEDGNKVKTELLATDRYTPLNKLILTGPKVKEPTIPEPIPTEDLIDDEENNPDEEANESNGSNESENSDGIIVNDS